MFNKDQKDTITRTCVDTDGKVFEVHNVPKDVNVITFTTSVFIRGGTNVFHQVETHRTEIMYHKKDVR